ncbi:MAG: hypothetical protein WAN36_11570 [Calditrichia bacterium]
MQRKSAKITESLNLDSLMDILTCTVGLMLLIVTIAILEAQGVRIKMTTPLVYDAPRSSHRNFFICNDQRIRYFGVDEAVRELFDGRQITYNNVPKLVRAANAKKVNDGYFRYSLEYEDWTEKKTGERLRKHRAIILVVNEVDSARGETIEEINKPESRFKKHIQQFNPEKDWLVFSVDKNSIKLFRRAREICKSQDLATGWDPGDIEFPYREVLLGGRSEEEDDIMNPRLPWSKPQN